MAIDPYTPVRDDWTRDCLPGWTERPQPVRTRPAPKPFRFLADMFSGVVIVASLAAIWIAVALIIDAAQGRM
jgi:hypothetical protein